MLLCRILCHSVLLNAAFGIGNEEVSSCIRPSLCIKSLNEWASQKGGVKYTETLFGKEYSYCMHTLPEIKVIERNALSEFVAFWYYFDDSIAGCGHSAIEIVFEYKHKYVVVILEGFEDSRRHGLISCHQLYGNNSDLGSKYLTRRSIKSTNYKLMKKHIFCRNKMSYQEMFDGPIKDINHFYVRQPYSRSRVVDGELILNHGCLWYATNLYAQIADISVHDLLNNPNISDSIIRFKTEKMS